MYKIENVGFIDTESQDEMFGNYLQGTYSSFTSALDECKAKISEELGMFKNKYVAKLFSDIKVTEQSQGIDLTVKQGNKVIYKSLYKVIDVDY